MMFEFVCEWLGRYFDLPCSYTIDGQDVPEFMNMHCQEWCEKSCGVVPAKDCWKKYFEALKEDKANDSRRAEKPGSGS